MPRDQSHMLELSSTEHTSGGRTSGSLSTNIFPAMSIIFYN